MYFPDGHFLENTMKPHVSAHFHQSMRAPFMLTYMETMILYLKNNILYVNNLASSFQIHGETYL